MILTMLHRNVYLTDAKMMVSAEDFGDNTHEHNVLHPHDGQVKLPCPVAKTNN